VSLYLADSSIWIGSRRRPGSYLAVLLEERIAKREVATCVPVALEVLVGAQAPGAYDEDWAFVWSELAWLPLQDRAARRALAVQRGLLGTGPGAHRHPVVDYLIAACAEDAGEGVVLWHWDDDLSVICEHTGQPHEPEHDRAREHGLQ